MGRGGGWAGDTKPQHSEIIVERFAPPGCPPPLHTHTDPVPLRGRPGVGSQAPEVGTWGAATCKAKV